MQSNFSRKIFYTLVIFFVLNLWFGSFSGPIFDLFSLIFFAVALLISYILAAIISKHAGSNPSLQVASGEMMQKPDSAPSFTSADVAAALVSTFLKFTLAPAIIAALLMVSAKEILGARGESLTGGLLLVTTAFVLVMTTIKLRKQFVQLASKNKP